MNNKMVKAIVIIVSIIFSIIGIFSFIFIVFIIVDTVEDKMYDNEVRESFSELILDAPDEFDKDDTYYINYSYDDNGTYCYMNIYPSEKYNTLEYEFNESVRYTLNDKVSGLNELNINGNKVLNAEVETEDSKEYYYGIESKNYYYIIKYSIYDNMKGDRSDIDTNLCYSAKDRIISSLNTLK